MKSAYNIVSFLFVCITQLGSIVYGQSDEQQLVREGNKLYKDKKYTEAEKNYLNALGKKGNSLRGAFNLGDAYYQQGKYKEAAEQFEMLAAKKPGGDTLSKIYHNLGNSYLKQKEFEKSINAYKNALKTNTTDEESRYNLAYAQKMLKQQQEKQKQEQEKKDQEKKNQENKDKDKQNNNKNPKKKNKIFPKKMHSDCWKQ
jgi:Ca-activated chloride channel homolog